MPKCPTCNKEVYFAEKITSVGKDWHRGCLRCAKCKKTLTPGSHAVHEDKPYCNRPCYADMFGPTGEVWREKYKEQGVIRNMTHAILKGYSDKLFMGYREEQSYSRKKT